MADLPPTGCSRQRNVVDSGVSVARVQPVCPRSADAFQANRKKRQGAHAHLLKAVGVGKFALKQDGASVAQERGICLVE